mmetsp:Transcript_117296/g.365230  ORF Transcript_117296/g.365230 Transcript_117296/m.365230 type:complete len:366 (+) Transcript_117296:433-1530(+)
MAFWIWPLQGQGNKSRGICPARAKRSAADKRAVANLLRLPPGTGAAPRACSPDDRQAPSIEVLGAVAALVPRRGGLGRPRPVPGLAADARPAHAVRVGLRLRLRLGLLLVLLLVVVAAKDLHKLGRRELPRARAGEDWGDVVALGAPVRVRAPLSVGVALVVAPASGHPGVIELPDAEALEGEEALGCHVEDREADLVDLGVRDDRVPLPRHDPPEGEAEPCDPHQRDEEAVLLRQVIVLVPAPDGVHNDEVRQDDDPEDGDPDEGRQDSEELCCGAQVVDVAGSRECDDVPGPHGHPEQGGNIPAREGDKRDGERGEGGEAVAGDDRGEHHHELQLRQGARHGIADVAHPVDVPDAEPACDAKG